MSDKKIPKIPNSETEEPLIKHVTLEEDTGTSKTNTNENGITKKVSFLRRLPSIRSSVTPSIRSVSSKFRKLNCFKSKSEEDLPMIGMDMPRHKSIDISVGLARRASLFLFRRKSVCMHPYHPYTPKVTTRKIYFGADIKKHHDGTRKSQNASTSAYPSRKE